MTANHGAIIICGGKSSRMGTSKPLLPFGPELLLQRIARIVRAAVAGPIVVVAARDQALPALPSDLKIVYDEHESLGPLEGLRVGLTALAGREIAYATSCDVPLLKPAFVRHVCASLTGDVAAAVAQTDGYLHPLAAAYRVAEVLPHVERLVAARKLRATGLFDEFPARGVSADELRGVDPELESLRNVNTPEDYRAALRAAGLPVDE